MDACDGDASVSCVEDYAEVDPNALSLMKKREGDDDGPNSKEDAAVIEDPDKRLDNIQTDVDGELLTLLKFCYLSVIDTLWFDEIRGQRECVFG